MVRTMSQSSRPLLNRLWTIWLVLASLAAAWLGMMLVHEAGHILFAWLTGAAVERVSLPIIGFSQTHLGVNPRPVTVAWGGFVVGTVVPFSIWAVAFWRRWKIEPGLRLFAAICLLANGAYMASALAQPIGDVEDIILNGGASWPLMVSGTLVLLAGVLLLTWRGIADLFRRACRATPGAVALATGALVAVCLISLVISAL